jgi:hypothetical protein
VLSKNQEEKKDMRPNREGMWCGLVGGFLLFYSQYVFNLIVAMTSMFRIGSVPILCWFAVSEPFVYVNKKQE